MFIFEIKVWHGYFIYFLCSLFIAGPGQFLQEGTDPILVHGLEVGGETVAARAADHAVDPGAVVVTTGALPGVVPAAAGAVAVPVAEAGGEM